MDGERWCELVRAKCGDLLNVESRKNLALISQRGLCLVC